MDDEKFEFSKETELAIGELYGPPMEGETEQDMNRQAIAFALVSIAKSLELLVAEVGAIKRTLGGE